MQFVRNGRLIYCGHSGREMIVAALYDPERKRSQEAWEKAREMERLLRGPSSGQMEFGFYRDMTEKILQKNIALRGYLR